MERVFATLFIVAFFSALPLYGLSSQRGWITVSGKRTGAGPFHTEIIHRDAFATRTEQLDVVGARVDFNEGGRRRAGEVVFKLETGSGSRELLREVVGTHAAVPQVVASFQQYADLMNSSSNEFHFELGPELTFWVMLGLVVVFAASGLLIAWGGSRKRR